MSDIIENKNEEVKTDASTTTEHATGNNVEGAVKSTDPAVIKAMEKAQAKLDKIAEKEAKKSISENEVAKLIDSIKDEDMKVVAKLLVEIKHENERQAKYVKRHSICSMASAILCLILVLVVFIWGVKFVPTIEKLANDATVLVGNTNELIADSTKAVASANGILADASEILNQTNAIIINLDDITTDLANVQIEETMDNVNSLVISSEENMTSAVKQIEEIDIESLNQAIKDLQAVVEPLSRLFKK